MIAKVLLTVLYAILLSSNATSVFAQTRQFGVDQCKPGFVWREATADDHICVTGATRKESADENRLAATRVDPNCAPREQCLEDCAADHDACMADVGTPGGPSPQQCIAKLRRCLAKCSRR